MEKIVHNAETGETTVVPLTPEEIAALATITSPPSPTLEELQAQLAELSAQIAALSQSP